MEISNKLQHIIQIQNDHSEEKFGELNKPITDEQIFSIEKHLDEPLPNEFKELYSFSNGQSKSGNGILFGLTFISSDEIIKQLEFCLTLVKPVNKTINNPDKSKQFLKTIIDFYIDKAPKHKFFGVKKSWYKIEFNCGVGSYGGPYIYFDENTTSKERETFKIGFGDYEIIAETIKQLHELEKSTHNWDELNFVVYSDTTYKVERSFYDFDNQISFTSTPENAIRKKYFHYKWLPLFSDLGGNYIGIDFDPDIKGIKGQIINFGRDEENMFVVADSLENFFGLLLTEIKNPNTKLLNLENHLIDILRALKK